MKRRWQTVCASVRLFHRKDLKLPQKAELFQTVPRGLLLSLCPEPFDSDTPGLNVKPPPWPSCRNPNPNWKIHPKTLLKQKLIYHFAPQKKRFTHLQLNSSTKAFFPSNIIVNLWSIVNPHSIRKVSHIFSSLRSPSLLHSNRRETLIYLKYLRAQWARSYFSQTWSALRISFWPF